MSAPAADSPRVTPSAPATADGAFCGHLHLEAAPRDDGRTVLARQSFRAPFHLSKPYWDGHVLQVQVVNPTAGVLAGDDLELDVRVRSGAALCVTTPAATRAFMMRSGEAGCRQQLTVENGGWLEFAPEPLCPHRGCSYAQHTHIDVAADGELCFVDALAPGRVGRGEMWQWTRLTLALNLDCNGTPVLRERLDASGAAMARAAEFHATPQGWLATMVLVSPRLAPELPCWQALRQMHGHNRWIGVTRLTSQAWVVRIVAPDGQDLRDVIAQARTTMAGVLPQLRTDLRKL